MFEFGPSAEGDNSVMHYNVNGTVAVTPGWSYNQVGAYAIAYFNQQEKARIYSRDGGVNTSRTLQHEHKSRGAVNIEVQVTSNNIVKVHYEFSVYRQYSSPGREDEIVGDRSGDFEVAGEEEAARVATYRYWRWDRWVGWLSYSSTMSVRVSCTMKNIAGLIPQTSTQEALSAFRSIAKTEPYFIQLVWLWFWYADGMTQDMIADALSKYKYVDINSLAYTRDLANLRQDVSKLLAAVKKIKNPKEWANLWLTYRYGLRLFILDTHEIIHAAQAPRNNSFLTIIRGHDSRSGVSWFPDDKVMIYGHTKVYVSNRCSKAESGLSRLRRLDLFPSLENLWDFVPYSFVVDWLLPVCQALKRLDAALDASYMPILSACSSVKPSIKRQLTAPFTGTLTYSLYTRTVSSASDLTRMPTLRGLSFASGLSLKHGIDSLCLVTQRLR